jgi:hypothetical protein
MAYNKYDDVYHTGMTSGQLKQAELLIAAQTAINRYFLEQPDIGNLPMDGLLIGLHLLPAVIAYAQPTKTGLQFRKYLIQQAINKEIQAYICSKY